jgi:hypothetical protein
MNNFVASLVLMGLGILILANLGDDSLTGVGALFFLLLGLVFLVVGGIGLSNLATKEDK